MRFVVGKRSKFGNSVVKFGLCKRMAPSLRGAFVGLPLAPGQLYKRKTTHHIGGKLVAWQILDILVRFIDDFSELFAINHFLVDVHRDAFVEVVGTSGIAPHNLGNGGAPAKQSNC